MKKFICVLLLICLVFVACDMGNDGTETISINELSIKDTGIKSLYVSDIPVNGNTRAASGSTIQTLCYINENGESSPFYFITPSGKNVMLETLGVQQVDEKRITINFAYYYLIIENEDGSYTLSESIKVDQTGLVGTDQRKALVDFEKNKVYDFSGLDVFTIVNDIAFVNDYNNGIIYKINLNNASIAIPLNNNSYFRVSGFTFFDNKIICHGSTSSNNMDGLYVVDINNDFPITPLKNTSITNDVCSFVSSYYLVKPFVYNTGWRIKDLSGDLWFFITGGKTPCIRDDYYWDNDGNRKYFYFDSAQPDKYFISKINIDDEGQLYLTDYYEDVFSFVPSYNTNSRVYYVNSAGNSVGSNFAKKIIIVCNGGFIALTMETDGIQIDSKSLSTSLPTLEQEKSFIKDGYLYYLENTSIKRIHLSAGSSAEIVYSNNRILTTESITLSGDTIFFYQFADDNISVNTYSLSLNQQNPTPKLLSTSSVEIRGIVELDF